MWWPGRTAKRDGYQRTLSETLFEPPISDTPPQAKLRHSSRLAHNPPTLRMTRPSAVWRGKVGLLASVLLGAEPAETVKFGVEVFKSSGPASGARLAFPRPKPTPDGGEATKGSNRIMSVFGLQWLRAQGHGAETALRLRPGSAPSMQTWRSPAETNHPTKAWESWGRETERLQLIGLRFRSTT